MDSRAVHSDQFNNVSYWCWLFFGFVIFIHEIRLLEHSSFQPGHSAVCVRDFEINLTCELKDIFGVKIAGFVHRCSWSRVL
jgi:hypothetical protein